MLFTVAATGLQVDIFLLQKPKGDGKWSTDQERGGRKKVGLEIHKGRVARKKEERECRDVPEGNGYVWMSEEAESICEVTSEKMNEAI